MSTKTKITIDRLVEFMDYKNLNDNQITKLAGLSVGLIGRARKNKSGLHTDTIEKILDTFPELNPTWLLTGKGDMLVSENNTNISSFSENPSNENAEKNEEDFIHVIFSTQKEVISSLKKKYFKTEEAFKK